jgi:hypothetical protein
MTATLGATVIIVAVAAAGLFVFLYLVFHAERHPDTGRGGAPRRKITGGIFRGNGRQVMPRRDAPAEVLTPDEHAGRDDGGPSAA